MPDLQTFDCLSSEESSVFKSLETTWIPVKRDVCYIQCELNTAWEYSKNGFQYIYFQPILESKY